MNQSRFFVLSVLLCILVSIGHAVPIQLNHQGRLLDASSNPVTGNYNLTFRLFTDSIGGNNLWEETQSVTVDDGLFATKLGTLTTLDFSALGVRPDSLWLEIQINADAPIVPRTQLTVTPISAVAQSLQGDIHIDNNNILFFDSLGDTTISIKSEDDGVIQTTTWTQTSGPFKFTTRTGSDGLTNVGISKDDAQRALNATLNDELTGLVIIDSLGDTTYQLTDKAEVRVEKFQHKQEFGPTQRTSQGADGSSAYLEASSFDTNDSSSAIVQAIEPRATLKTYFETGDVPTSALIGSESDSTYLDIVYDTIADASIRVSANGSVLTLSEGKDTPDGARGYEFSVHPDRMELRRGIREGGHTIGAGEVLSVGASSITMTDSLGDTTYHFEDNTIYGYRVYNKRKFSQEMLTETSRALSSIQFQETSDTTIMKKNEIGTTSSTSYLVMLDSINDTTVVIESSTGPFTGGRLVIKSGDAGMGIPPGQVEITDLTSDGLTDIKCDGNIGIGVQIPTNILEVAQNSSTDPIADAWTTYSSRRWKENIKPIENALSKVQQLRGVEYDWKADGKHDIGLIAEEVGEVIPEIVVYEKNGIDAQSVDYPRLVALLIEASKEQQKEVDNLKNEVEILKALVLKLAGTSTEKSNSLYGQK